MGILTEGLNAEPYDRAYSTQYLLKRILTYFRRMRALLFSITVFVFLSTLANLFIPVFISLGIDQLTEQKAQAQIVQLVITTFLLGMLLWLVEYLRNRQTAVVVSKAVLQLAQDAFDAVMAKEMPFYDKFLSGTIISRVTTDTQMFSRVVTLSVNFFSQLLLVLLSLVVLFLLNWRLSLLAIALIPLVVGVALRFRHRAREVIQHTQRTLASLNAVVSESVNGIAVAKSFHQEALLYREFSRVNQQSYHVHLRKGFVFGSIYPVLGLITGAGTVAIAYYGGLEVFRHHISPGSWFYFLYSISFFWVPLTGIASFWSQFQQGLAASERVFALMDTEREFFQTDKQIALRLQGRVEFIHVNFQYGAREEVLQDINLTVNPGEVIALLGRTGAGKSSLMKLLMRFYEFQSGQILVDGHDIRSFALDTYRSQIGFVPQEPFLFSGTVLENIAYACPHVPKAEIRQRIGDVMGEEWLDSLSQGLETEVGERGQHLSVGQRQLVVLARVLLQDPAILILDEATTSVDLATEAKVQETLRLVLKGRTAFIIAHRLSTVKYADRIIVLDQGRIVEMGTKQMLYDKGGIFTRLYQMYYS